MIDFRFSGAAMAIALGLGLSACAPEYDPQADGSSVKASVPAGDAATLEEVRARLAAKLPDVEPESVQPAGVAGLYEIRLGSLFGYVTPDGNYLIEGDLIDLVSGQSLTENKRKTMRVAKLEELGPERMIVFAPENPKYRVTVFTDIDCGYCRKLHREIDQYTERGIAIQYAFYPRSGPGSESFRKAEAVWCADDRKQALTLAKAGNAEPGDNSCDNPVEMEWELGAELGLRGTPMLVLPNGEVVNGYVPAPALADRLEALAKG